MPEITNSGTSGSPGPVPTAKYTTGDIAGRTAIILLYLWQAQIMITQWMATGRLTSLLFLIASSLLAWFTATRRPATNVETSVAARCVAMLGTFAPMGFRPAEWQLAPDRFLAIIAFVGALMAIASITYLGRNFGIIAAHRGVSQGGPYSLLRHPLYTSYAFMHVAYVCANISVWNVTLLLVSETSQMARALFEERVLSRDPVYSAYMQRVRWRMIPGVF
jgi:protein-S-isoprenylcysteine O-methyltransferase Ste14